MDEFTGKLWEIYETIKSEGGPVQVKCWSSLCFLDLMQDMNDLLFRGETLKGKDISLWTKGRSQKNGKLWEFSQHFWFSQKCSLFGGIMACRSGNG